MTVEDTVSFDVPDEAIPFIDQILDRVEALASQAGSDFDRLSARMDLQAAHANGNPLDFERMSKARDFDIAHDVFGIARHIDRSTGKLIGYFSPRFSIAA